MERMVSLLNRHTNVLLAGPIENRLLKSFLVTLKTTKWRMLVETQSLIVLASDIVEYAGIVHLCLHKPIVSRNFLSLRRSLSRWLRITKVFILNVGIDGNEFPVHFLLAHGDSRTRSCGLHIVGDTIRKFESIFFVDSPREGF